MNHRQWAALIALLMLSACSGGTTSPPALTANAISTRVAAAVRSTQAIHDAEQATAITAEFRATQISIETTRLAESRDYRAAAVREAETAAAIQLLVQPNAAQRTIIAQKVQETIAAMPTATALPTSTPRPIPTSTPTPTRIVPKINLIVLGCYIDADPSPALTVTNVYILLQNVGQVELTNVTVRVQASNQGKAVIDNSVISIDYMPPSYQIPLMLTADTNISAPTTITITLQSNEKRNLQKTVSGCSRLDPALKQALLSMFASGGVIPVRIPGLAP